MNSTYWIDRPHSEEHNVFTVVQVAANTPLSDLLGADFLRIEPNQQSEIHKHNFSRTVIIVTQGEAVAILDNKEFKVTRGERIFIDNGVFHGFRTADVAVEFMSIQTPPILDHEKGIFDKEVASG